VFGPALIEAARIEAEESIFPRILVHKNVIECCEACGHFPELRNMYMIEDYFGSHILNLFNIIGYGQGEYWDRMLVKTIPIDKIWEIVHTQAEHFCASSSKKQAEKWIYMKKLIEEKIFVIYPLLKEQVNFGSRAKNVTAHVPGD